jgi:acyl carrier protein
MDELKSRLIRCFEVVFPGLDDSVLSEATMTSIADWDSIATVTLINVVEEEFGVTIDVDNVEQMVSFEAMLKYLAERGVPAA